MKKETFLKIAYICLSIMLIALTIGWVISGIDMVIEEVSAEEITPIPTGNGAVYTENYKQATDTYTNYFGFAINPFEDLTEEGWSSLSYTISSNFKYQAIRTYFGSNWKDTSKQEIQNKGYKKIKINGVDYYSFNFSINMNYNSLQLINANSQAVSGYPYQYLYIYFVVDNANVGEIGLYSNSSKTQYILSFKDLVNHHNYEYYLHDPQDSTTSYTYFNVTLPADKFDRFTYRDNSYALNISDSSLSTTQISNLYLAFNTQNYNFIYGSSIQDAFYSGYNQAQEDVNNYWQNYYKNEYESRIEQAYQEGKEYGLNHNTNTAWGSSWDFIGSAFNGVGNILAIELLPNIPLWTFIAIPLLFGLIALLYKLIGG